MTDLLVDPRFWGAIVGALFVGFLAGLLILSLLRGNDRPEVIGAIRRRCEICERAWATTPATDDELALCPSCLKAATEDAGKWGPP